MKLFLLLSAVFTVGHCTFTFIPCHEDDPRCTCDPPNGLPGTPVQVGDEANGDQCFCYCGKAIGDFCSTDADCVVGSFCAALDQLDSHADADKGICKDKCSKTVCSEFSQCVVNGLGIPECHGRSFTCTEDVDLEVCAFDAHVQSVQRFPNLCFLINEYFKRSESGDRDSLKRRDCTTMRYINVH